MQEHKTQERKKYLIIDFDRTIPKGHTHNAIAGALKKNEIKISSFVAALWKFEEKKRSLNINWPTYDQEAQWEYLKKQKELIQPTGGVEGARRWREVITKAVKEGYTVAIASFSSFSHIIKMYLKDILELPAAIMKEVKIQAYLPKNPREANKNGHIIKIIAETEKRTEQEIREQLKQNKSDRQVVLVDDSEANGDAAKTLGFKYIPVDDINDHLGEIDKLFANENAELRASTNPGRKKVRAKKSRKFIEKVVKFFPNPENGNSSSSSDASPSNGDKPSNGKSSNGKGLIKRDPFYVIVPSQFILVQIAETDKFEQWRKSENKSLAELTIQDIANFLIKVVGKENYGDHKYVKIIDRYNTFNEMRNAAVQMASSVTAPIVAMGYSNEEPTSLQIYSRPTCESIFMNSPSVKIICLDKLREHLELNTVKVDSSSQEVAPSSQN